MNRIFLPITFLALLFLSCSQEKKEFGLEISTEASQITKGKQLFEQHCSSCHRFDQDAIGPNLSGLTRQVETEWIREFIKNPAALLEKKDPRALALLEKYRTQMPSYPQLQEGDLDAVLSYLHTFSTAPIPMSGDTTSNLIPEKIQDSGIRLGLELFAQLPPSDSKPPLTKMTKMEPIPGTSRLMINDQRLGLYELTDGKPKLYLNLVAERPLLVSQPGWATGLGSFAFHPEFEKNGLFYTSHTEPRGSGKADVGYTDSLKVFMQWVLTEWKAANPQASIFKGTSRELLRVNNASQAHGMQELTFNPTAKKGLDEDYGLLYIGYGDGGTAEAGFPEISNQQGRGMYSGIWRIDPLGTSGRNGKYGIPASNPFAKSKDKAGELYAYGFRNPNRIFWDGSGQLFATDIGQHSIEEINRIEAGQFYGWPIREGRFVINPYGSFRSLYPLPAGDQDLGIRYPFLQLEHDELVAIIGGYVVNSGPLQGKFVFGDVPSGRLFFVDLNVDNSQAQTWGIRYQGKEMSLKELVGQDRVDLKFGLDAKKQLYLMSKTNGAVYRVLDE